MVKGYKPELTNLQQGILNFLLENPTREFNMRKLAVSLKVSQPAIMKAISLLKKKSYVNIYKNKDSSRYSIRLNWENHLVFGLKRARNIGNIYKSGIVDSLFNSFPGATIILFGSYSYGEDIEDSDIDIVIVGNKEKELDLSKYEKKLNKKINLNFYDSFWEIQDKHLLNNIINGVVLIGRISL